MGSFDSTVSFGSNALVINTPTNVATINNFLSTVTLKSSLAVMPVIAVQDADVGTGKQAFLTNFIVKVNGSTAWLGTVSVVRIMDTANNILVVIPVASLVSNATIFPNSSGLTLNQSFTLSQGSALGTGLKVVADANASVGGSDLVVTLQGVIK